MGKISGIGLAFMLFASLGFAWTTGYAPPACMTQYTVTGVNFTYAAYNSQLCGATSNWQFAMSNNSRVAYSAFNALSLSTLTSTGTLQSENLTYIALPSSGNGNITIPISISTIHRYCGSGGDACGGVGINGTGTLTLTDGTASFNETTMAGLPCSGGDISLTNSTTITATCISRICNVSSSLSNKSFTTSASRIYITRTINMTGSCTSGIVYTLEAKSSGTANWTSFPISETAYEVNGSLAITPLDYISLNNQSSAAIHSDFKNANITLTNSSNYCQSLIYFNNPYYGNIQLIPRITYIPGVDAFPNFINASSNAAYLPNNTISYIFDSVTSIWYIVPATICSSYSIVGSTTTLQYNPTATGTAVGGTVPIYVTGITGSCSYATGTRIITCIGTDTSNTVTSLNLSAYLTGNTTDLCGSGVAGASGTLTCTLPAQNGTYNAMFYGIDANLFLHSFASKTITIGTGSIGYGRDAYIAVFLLAGVAALLLSSNIAVSMVLMCFGLFVALAVGALPISDAPIVVFFTVIALVLAYRLKV